VTLPDYLLIGAQKCGTTWLAAMLSQHPEVFTPETKELHFFDRAARWARGPEWYASCFEGAEGAAAVGEATPNYLGVACAPPEDAVRAFERAGCTLRFEEYEDAPPDVVERIHALLPELRLIAMLRSPVDRAISSFYHHVRMRRIAPTRRILDAAGEWGILSIGFYHVHLQRWLARYARERLLVLLYEEDVQGDKEATLRRVFEHLGVDPGFAPAEAERRFNERSSDPWMFARYYSPSLARLAFRAVPALHGLPWPRLRVTPEERAVLADAYAGEIARLEELLGRSLDVWRAP